VSAAADSGLPGPLGGPDDIPVIEAQAQLREGRSRCPKEPATTPTRQLSAKKQLRATTEASR